MGVVVLLQSYLLLVGVVAFENLASGNVDDNAARALRVLLGLQHLLLLLAEEGALLLGQPAVGLAGKVVGLVIDDLGSPGTGPIVLEQLVLVVLGLAQRLCFLFLLFR